MIETVIWDWNGTLLDDLSVSFEATNRLLAANGRAPLADLDCYRAVFSFPVIDYYRRIGFDFDQLPFDQLAQQYMDFYHPAAENCSLQSGAQQILEHLHQSGLRQVLLSASKQSHLEMQLARYPIAQYFDRVLGIQNIYAASKQQLAIDFIAQSGQAATDFLFVGDSVHDFEVAQSCGARCVLFSGGHQARSILEATGAPVIDALNELPAICRALSDA